MDIEGSSTSMALLDLKIGWKGLGSPIKVVLIAGGGLELENVWISEGEQMGLGFNF